MIDLRQQLRELGIDLPPSAHLEGITTMLARWPAQTTLGIVAASAVAFYHAERRYNRRVRDIYDALLYCATCLNVGYAEVHPVTPIGKLIGAGLQTYGPALAARMLDGQSASRPRAAASPARDATAAGAEPPKAPC